MSAAAVTFAGAFEGLEQLRADAVRATGIFGTPPEDDFDELVDLARELCGTSIGAMTLLDEKEQFIKAASGAAAASGLEGGSWMPIGESICQHVVHASSALCIRDTTHDRRSADLPCVKGAPHIRFYSGVPLYAETGEALGAMCVMDTQPRVLNARQQRALSTLARQVEARIQLRARMQLEQKQAQAIEAQRKLLHHFLDNIPLETTMRDMQGRILFYNKAVSDHFKVSRTEWLGKTDVELFGLEKGGMLRAEQEHAIRMGQRTESYLNFPAPDGTNQYWKVIRSVFRLPEGEQVLASIGVNLTEDLKREAALVKLQEELKEANRKLRSLSLTDELTGLWNRRAFDARLEMELHDAERRSAPLALLLMDVDNFKSFNDTYGHCHGDEVLAEVGSALRHAVRAHDMAVRYGGEEFAIIVPGADMEGARALAARVAELLEAVNWKHRKVTMSIGIAMCRHGMSSEDLLWRADAAMYHAKRNGKNRAVVYGEELVLTADPFPTAPSPALSACLV